MLYHSYIVYSKPVLKDTIYEEGFLMKTNQELLLLAKEASLKSYCIYSGFPVGACAMYSTGNYYLGCNVENSSYGLSLCAERNAISSAIVAGEKGNLMKIAIYSAKSKRCLPCGACRQWLSEFEKGQEIEIILEDELDKVCSFKIYELLPYAFNLNVI